MSDAIIRESMNTYAVEVLRMVAVTVTVTAANPEEAYEQVNSYNFPLPSVGRGEVLGGYEFVVYPANEQGEITGDELLRVD